MLCGFFVGELMVRLSPIVDENASNEVKQLLCECYLKNGDMIPYFLLQHGVWCVCWELSFQLIQCEFSFQLIQCEFSIQCEC